MKTYQFVTELEDLANNPNKKGDIATLRRGLMINDGDNPLLYQVIYPLMHKAISIEPKEKYLLEKKYYLKKVCQLAALFTIHPSTKDQYSLKHNLGHHLRIAAGERVEAAENRFKLILGSDEEELFSHLKHAISFIASSKTRTFINYHSLFSALCFWGQDEKRIQKEWAQGFWGLKTSQNADQENKLDE